MQKNTHRFIKIVFAFAFGIILIIQSCKKDETFPDPKIEFSTDTGFQSSDTTLKLNEEITIKILAETMSDVSLTQLHVKIDKDGEITEMDSGINTNILNYQKTISKSTAETETWTFYVADRNGRTSDEISLSFNLDESSTYGNIIHIPSVIMGGQDHTSTGGFYSLEKDLVYTQSEAFNDQSAINLVYYYDNVESDENTLASPDANIDASIYDFSGWTDPKNETEYGASSLHESITETEFTDSANDSLILNNTFEFGTGKRKAKKLAVGNIFSFVTHDSKKGLFRVLDVQGQETGIIEIEIKMQE